MNKISNGGPAFPVQSIYVEDQDTNSPGMSLRDYFAAKAMQGLLAQGNRSWDDIASRAYAVADAMISVKDENK